MNATGPTFFVE